jgi:uncharacterized protein (DUF1015 family)
MEISNIGFLPTNILIPSNVDMHKWSVVACDQYTSEPNYWSDVEAIVKDAPSTLRLTLPEIYLEGDNVEKRIIDINNTMSKYLKNKLFDEFQNSFIYVERTIANGKIRCGIMGAVDLEAYDYRAGAGSLIRATEGTVLERIPPRVKVRINAPLELPHIMVLIDDAQKSVIEPLQSKKNDFQKIYDFDLMKDGGHITGYLISKEAVSEISETLVNLANPQNFAKKYTSDDKDKKGVLLFAVGDGNHSLATAKECWERIKPSLNAEEIKNHSARYALVELVNVHNEALEFKPIHRVLFDCNPHKVVDEMLKFFSDSSTSGGNGQKIGYVYAGKSGEITVPNPPSGLAVGTLQQFLDSYVKQNDGKIDYIHGEDVVNSLSNKPNNIGFFLPVMGKSELFKTVITDGVLPRKTFSMGEAKEKRFYLECRKIRF